MNVMTSNKHLCVWEGTWPRLTAPLGNMASAVPEKEGRLASLPTRKLIFNPPIHVPQLSLGGAMLGMCAHSIDSHQPHDAD